MSFLKLFTSMLKGVSASSKRSQCQKLTAPTCETLEERVVLYADSGNAWPEPQLVTISFVPDGTNLGGVYSNLNAAFDAKPALQGIWKQEILRAAQAWAQVTNINFAVVSDSGVPIGSGAYQQGSPTYGDIRIGGYEYYGSSLAGAFMPPEINNWPAAGDVTFNTSTYYTINGAGGSGYDLYTVAVHEIGHALGLDHSAVSNSQMYSIYNGAKPNLASDDIAGIRHIYSNGSAREKDGYETASGNDTINNAKNIAGDLVRAKGWALIDGLDITTTSDVDFYRLAMPAWAAQTLVVKVQSAGFSQLAPKLTIYDKDKTTVLGTVSGAGQHGTSLSLSISGITGTDVFYIKVEAAEATAFGTGAYGITLDAGATSTPVLPLPNTMLANGNPFSAGGGVALGAEGDVFEVADDLVFVVAPDAPSIDDLPATGKVRSLTGTTAPGTQIAILDNGIELGTTTADDTGRWSFDLVGKLTKGKHRLTAVATNHVGNSSAQSDVRTVTVTRPRRISRIAG